MPPSLRSERFKKTQEGGVNFHSNVATSPILVKKYQQGHYLGLCCELNYSGSLFPIPSLQCSFNAILSSTPKFSKFFFLPAVYAY